MIADLDCALAAASCRRRAVRRSPGLQIARSPDQRIISPRPSGDRRCSTPSAPDRAWSRRQQLRHVSAGSDDSCRASAPCSIRTSSCILSLKPQLVVIYGSQADLKQQLARAGIGVFRYRHAGLADVTDHDPRARRARRRRARRPKRSRRAIERWLDGIRQKRQRTARGRGRCWSSAASVWRCAALRERRRRVPQRHAGRRRRRERLRRRRRLQAVQASTEQVIARRPDVILEVRAVNSAWPSGEREAELTCWNDARLDPGRPQPSACSSSSTIAS